MNQQQQVKRKRKKQRQCQYKTSKDIDQLVFIIQGDGKQICSLCYSICQNKQHSNTDLKVQYSSQNSCTCTNHLPYDQCQKMFENLYKNVNSVRSLLALNVFLSLYIDEKKTIISSLWEQSIHNINNDIQIMFYNQNQQIFEWDLYDVLQIDERIGFVKFFNKELQLEYLLGLDQRNIFQVFPLEYIIKVFDYPERSYGQQIYNNVLNYHTYILNFFITHHLKKDFLTLNFIDAQQLKYSNIYQRQELNHFNRLQVSNKYFSNNLNIANFIQVLLENFIPTIHWRWIGANHKVHIYTIYIIKLLFQYQCLNQDEAEILLISLENKINNLKVLEQSIDRDTEVINKHWINIWREGMSQIRLYLIEIILHMTYLKLDNLIITQKNIKFQEYSQIFFESDFSILSQNMVLNYILSNQKIDGVSLISRETQLLCLEFFNIMYNYEDGYYLNLQPPHILKKKPSNDQFLKQLIDQYFISKSKAFNEKQILDDFKDLIKTFSQIQSDELQFQILPELILFIKLFKEFFQKDNESGILIQKLLEKTYQESGFCLILFQNKCQNILSLLEIWPLNIIGVLNSLANQTLHNLYLYELILAHYTNQINQIFKQELEIDKIDFELINFIIQETLFLQKLVTDQDDFDIIGQRALIKLIRQIIKPDIIFKLLEDYQPNKKRPEDLYIEFSFQFLKLINLLSQIRYLSETLEEVKIFTLSKIIEFSQICILNIEFNKQVAWMVYIFFIDQKDSLITNRELYYIKKHNDSLYFEDIFTKNDYALLLQYFYPQYNNKIKSYLEKDSFNYTQQNYIYSGILKLCRHLLQMKFKDIDKFISQINEFEQFLIKISDLEPQQKKIEVLQKIDSYKDNPRKIILIIQMIQDIVQSKIVKQLIKDQQQISFLKNKKKGKEQLNRYNSLYHENGKIRHEFIDNNTLGQTLGDNYLKAKQDLNLYSQFFLDPQLQNFSSNLKSNKIQDLFNFFNNIFNSEKDNFYIFHNAIEIFCNIFFRDSGSFCEEFANYINENKNFQFLDNIWQELVRNLNIVNYKSMKDKLYNDSFQKTQLLLIFHRCLVKNSSTFRKSFGDQKIEKDSLKMVRVERLETLLEKVLEQSSDQDFIFLQNEILHTQYLVILENPINKLKVYTCLSGYKRSILEKNDMSANQIQINLLKFFNELVYPHNSEINQFVSNVIEYNVIEDLLYQRVKNFYDPHQSHKLKYNNYSQLIDKYKQTFIKNSHNEYLDCAIQCFIYIKLVTTNYIDKEIKNKNIFYCFLNDILQELEFQNQEGEISKLMIKNDLRNQYITKRTKQLILFEMDKSSFYSQIKSLSTMLEYIDYESKYLYTTGIAKFTSVRYKLLDSICIYIGFIIFILILIDQSQDQNQNGDSFVYNNKYKNLVDILGFIIIGISFIFIALYLKFTYKLELKKAQFFRQIKQRKINILEWIWILFFECLIFNGISGSFCWYLGGTVSAMYASQQNYFLIIIQCLNLYDGFKETMGDILHKFKKLVWLSFLVCFIIYAFSFTVWTQFKIESFKLVQNSYDQQVNPCQNSLIECFIYFANTGYQIGMGELLNYESLNDQQGYVNGFFFIKNIMDVLFYLFIQVLFIALVVAQVIDGITHGHRERREIKNMLQRCLVCNVHRSQFEKLGIDYEEHCNKIHSVWSYLIFMINLINDKSKSYDNFELELLRQKILQKNLSWFPNQYQINIVEIKNKSNQI